MSNRPNPIAIHGRRRHHVVLLLAQLVPLFAVTDWVHAGLIAHWTFDVNASDAVGAHPGTLQGGAFISSDGGAIAGQALLLDGDGDYVSIPYSSEFQLGAGTVSLWFRGGPSSQQRPFYALIDFHHGSAHGPSHGWAILGGIAEDRVQLATGLPIVNFFGANALLDSGAFHHFVATFQPGGNAVLYVDGQQQGTVSLPSPFAYIDGSPPLSIGRWGAAADEGNSPNARDYLGRIDDVQIFNHALGASEVSYLYNNPGTTLATIPAVSEWGLIVMAGLVVVAGGSILANRRLAAS